MPHAPASMAPAPRPLSSRHFAALDGYRGLAFLLVFFRHYGLSSRLHGPVLGALKFWIPAGWVGVDLFFALSGFLITGILLDTAGHPHFFRNFMARRALRIFPLYYGVALLLLLLTPLLHLRWQPGHLFYLVYLGNFAYCADPSLGVVPPAVSLLHLWSLAVEEQFYLLWPGVIYLLVRAHRRRWLPWLCLSLSLLSFLLRWQLLHSRLASPEDWVYAMLPAHMDGLLAGAVAAYLLRAVPLQQLRRPARWALCAAALATAAVLGHGGPDLDSHSMLQFGVPALAVLFSSLLLLSLAPGSLAGRLGSLRPLRFFGRYSYGMYVFHLLFWPLSSRLLALLQRALHSILWGGLAYVATMLAATTLVSVLSYRLYERHWLRMKTRFADQPASQAPAAAS